MISALAGNIIGRGSRTAAARHTIHKTRFPEKDDALNWRGPSQEMHLARRLSIIGCHPGVPAPAALRKRLTRRVHGIIVENIAGGCCSPGRPGSRMGSENRMSGDMPWFVINGALELPGHSRAEKTGTCRSLAQQIAETILAKAGLIAARQVATQPVHRDLQDAPQVLHRLARGARDLQERPGSP